MRAPHASQAGDDGCFSSNFHQEDDMDTYVIYFKLFQAIFHPIDWISEKLKMTFIYILFFIFKYL